MTTHSKKFSPSSAHRWINCPGSVRLLEKITHRIIRSEDHAEEGTKAHELSETLIAANDHETYSDHEFYENVLEYVESVKANDNYVIERKVSFNKTFGIKGGFGTPDCVVFHEFGDLEVKDFKYGFVSVSSIDNEQLMLYALGAIGTYKLNPANIKLSIYQPRIKNYSSHTITRDELGDFKEKALKSIIKIENDSDELIVGEKQCRYCDVRHLCPALFNKTQELISENRKMLEVLSL